MAGRLFSVLDAFESGGPPALRLTDIAARTGLPAPTALRLVRELVSWGGLERGADGRYRLGLRLRVLGAAAPCPRGLLDAALPALRALAARTGGHADLAVVSDPPAGGVLCLVSGERPPMHATAYGKVLLAAPPAELPRHTRHTVVSPASWPASSPGSGRRVSRSAPRSSGWARCRWPLRCGARWERWARWASPSPSAYRWTGWWRRSGQRPRGFGLRSSHRRHDRLRPSRLGNSHAHAHVLSGRRRRSPTPTAGTPWPGHR